jgi:hypothetical protein
LKAACIWQIAPKWGLQVGAFLKGFLNGVFVHYPTNNKGSSKPPLNRCWKKIQRMSKTFYVSLFTKQIEVEGKKTFALIFLSLFSFGICLSRFWSFPCDLLFWGFS